MLLECRYKTSDRAPSQDSFLAREEIWIGGLLVGEAVHGGCIDFEAKTYHVRSADSVRGMTT
ncbi:hypothetical protein SAMN05216210_0343 [Halopseudomonas salegens]|uniref:Uncharacterized protein n=1 Tax=Halopseudomonas salegens TaxID=1434072 RepID=A0A1H2E598_9GAMM|nr:hypothetical protein SAMN05216210_0343 [Halopseudomonas salegens]